MKEHNYTIPLTEALEADVSCFLCKIEDELEARALDYYMGAAVMEPSVRIETNQKGFCRQHAEEMLEMPKKLPLLLALQTRLDTVADTLKKEKKPGKRGKRTCAVCDRVAGQMDKCLENCVWLLRTEPDFLQKFEASQGVCLHHFHVLAERMGKGDSALYAKLHKAMQAKLEALAADISSYTRSFDYRNTPGENIGAVPARAVETLTEKRG